jgi:lipoprotein NlpI
MAAASGQVAAATEIFEALVRLRPTKSFPYVGKAVALLYVGLFPAAIELLSAATQVVETDQEQIWIYLALAFQRNGFVVKARTILNYLLDSGELSDVDTTFVKAILNGDRSADHRLPKPCSFALNDSIHSLAVVI